MTMREHRLEQKVARLERIAERLAVEIELRDAYLRDAYYCTVRERTFATLGEWPTVFDRPSIRQWVEDTVSEG